MKLVIFSLGLFYKDHFSIWLSLAFVLVIPVYLCSLGFLLCVQLIWVVKLLFNSINLLLPLYHFITKYRCIALNWKWKSDNISFYATIVLSHILVHVYLPLSVGIAIMLARKFVSTLYKTYSQACTKLQLWKNRLNDKTSSWVVNARG